VCKLLNVTILLRQGELQANKQHNTTTPQHHKRMPLPVELTMSQSLKGDTSHVQAHHCEWEVLLVIHRHSVDVTSQGNEMGSVTQIQQVQETQHPHST
jgi:hypothetical protein